MFVLIRVGCCGWAVKGGKDAYFHTFDLIELQSTFYKLPRIETASRWRMIAPRNFVYTLKAWQVITHPYTSPTWRKAGIKMDSSKAKHYGFLKPTSENFEAWMKTLSICKVLDARICVFQTPASFKFSDEHVKWVYRFFNHIVQDDVLLGWEPRGDWNKHLDVVREICRSFDIIHVVDVFRRDPVSDSPVIYIRLHGIGAGEVNYKYKYTDDDLKFLLGKVKGFVEAGFKEIYILFNNVFMADDALRFKKLLERSL